MSKLRKYHHKIESYAAAIVATVREPLLILDTSFHIIFANRAYYKIFHTTKSETENKLIYSLGNGHWGNENLRKLLQSILSTKKPFDNYEIENEFPIIGYRIMHLNGRLLKNVYNAEPKILLAIDDVTDRMQIERQKDDFIGIASHELKTPVTSIKLYEQILLKHHMETKDKKSTFLLKKMDEQLNRLNELVASFVNVYKIRSGKLKLKKKRFSIDALIDDVIENFKYSITSHTIERIGYGNRAIFADKERIAQVLINLISNAVKYSPGATRVIVRTEIQANDLLISVQDFGMGIPKEEQSKVFGRFYRARGKREGNIPGLGLGLFISEEIVKRHKGKIWLKSTVDIGSTFSFSLPLRITTH